MAGINTTGVPSTQEYLIGRGIMQWAELDAAGLPKSFRDIGNVPELTITSAVETYEHYSSRAGLKQRDLRIVLQQDLTMGFIVEHINFNNLAAFVSGEAKTYTNPAIAGFTDKRIVNDGELEVNRYYMVHNAGKPVFGITSTNAITVKTTDSSPVTLVKDTDYTVDTVSGMIFVKSTVTTLAAVSGGKGLTVTLTADAAATTVDTIEALTANELNVAVRFIGENAETGKKVVYDFHKVTLTPDGDFSIISDEAAQLPFTGGAEKSDAYANVADFYYPVTQA